MALRDLDTTGVELWATLRKTFNVLDLQASKSIAALQMCHSDFAILASLLNNGSLPVNTLGKEMLLTSGSITVAIDRLEKRKLVQRTWQQDDRRVCLVSLTSEGERLIGGAFEQHVAAMHEAFSRLSHSEQKSLRTLLEKAGPKDGEKPIERARASAPTPKQEHVTPTTLKPLAPIEDVGFAGFTELD